MSHIPDELYIQRIAVRDDPLYVTIMGMPDWLRRAIFADFLWLVPRLYPGENFIITLAS